jgi:hypothetical protein
VSGKITVWGSFVDVVTRLGEARELTPFQGHSDRATRCPSTGSRTQAQAVKALALIGHAKGAVGAIDTGAAMSARLR